MAMREDGTSVKSASKDLSINTFTKDKLTTSLIGNKISIYISTG